MPSPRNYRSVTWNFDPELLVALEGVMEDLNEGLMPGEQVISLNDFVTHLLAASVAEHHKQKREGQPGLIQLANFKPGLEGKVRGV